MLILYHAVRNCGADHSAIKANCGIQKMTLEAPIVGWLAVPVAALLVWVVFCNFEIAAVRKMCIHHAVC